MSLVAVAALAVAVNCCVYNVREYSDQINVNPHVIDPVWRPITKHFSNSDINHDNDDDDDDNA